MTVADLERECQRRRTLGMDWLTLVVPRKSPPKGERIRVAPGLTGQLLAVNADGDVVASVKLADVERYLAKRRDEIAR